MRLSYSNVMATIAVFIALGGTSYAVVKLPRNSVGTEQVKNRSLRSEDLARGAIAAVRGPRGPEGPQGAAGPQGPAGVASIITAEERAVMPLSLTPGGSANVVELLAPPGRWWFIGSASAVNEGVGDQFRCHIVFGQTMGAASTVARVGVDATSSLAANLVLHEGRTLTATTAVRLRCHHDGALSGGNPRIDHGQLTAIRADSLEIQ